MPVKKHPYRKAYCRCTSRKCGEVEYIDDNGQLKHGNLVNNKTLLMHQLEDEIALHIPPNSESSTSTPSTREPSPARGEPLNLPDEVNTPEAGPSRNPTVPTERPADRASQGMQSQNLSSGNAQTYDTAIHITNHLETANPILIYALLITAALVVFENVSTGTASWLLVAFRGFIELITTLGLGGPQHHAPLSYSNRITLDEMPAHIRTVFSRLQLDSDIMIFNSCPSCFALYHIGHTPSQCNHPLEKVPGLFSLDPPDESVSLEENDQSDDSTCSQPLFKQTGQNLTPIRQYAVQDLHSWLARLISRPDMEETLDRSLAESSKPYSPDDDVSDIHQSLAWKEFQDKDGSQFTASSGNLVFGMFVDGINPYGNKTSGKHASITFIVLVCLTLPIESRFLPENIFLVGIAPGPSEPSLEQMNHVLSPVVQQLKTLWHDGIFLSATPAFPNGRLIRAALLPFVADLPALRRSLGFASYRATQFCSFCYLKISQITNFIPSSWRARTAAHHRKHAFACRDAEQSSVVMNIFKKHGLRYSVLNELEYWSPVDFQVVDSMHNLLLGMLQWHCRDFWSMSDHDEVDPEPKASTVAEVQDMLQELIVNEAASDQVPQDQYPDQSASSHTGIRFADAEFGTNTTSTDPDFETQGWNGSWIGPSDPEDIVFDKRMLRHINGYLPRIHIATWINRPVRTLGKISLGKLKADEWRNLFTIQLPLILIPAWTNGDQRDQSLLQNFSHLVSLTNLGLKRTMNSEVIRKYRSHLQAYLEGCLILFPHCDLASNHHIAFHLADCLEKFGPVRAWWSFPFERLMGKILKGEHNNHLGQLEITFLNRFCRAGNFATLLKDKRVPQAIYPFLSILISLIEPKPFVPQTISSSPPKESINPVIYKQLIAYMNRVGLDDCAWISASQWSFLPQNEKEVSAPVRSHATYLKRITHNGVTYTTFDHNQNDGVIHVKTGLSGMSFGKITSIFSHQRVPAGTTAVINDTWLSIELFLPIPTSTPNCFTQLQEPDLQAHLRLKSSTPSLIHIDQIVAHCAWIEFRPKEITPQLNMATIGLVSLAR